MENKKYNFTIALAILDIFPCIFFGIAMLILDEWFRSPIYIAGVLICTFAGIGKVFWKLLISLKKGHNSFLDLQFRFAMPTGLVLILVSMATGNRRGIAEGQIIAFVFQSPFRWLLFVGGLGLAFMVIWRLTRDMAQAFNNWIAEIVNTIVQSLILLGVICLVYVGDYYHYNATYTKEELAVMYDSSVVEYDDYTVFVPTVYEGYCPSVGLVFYPGGKVEADAYIPLMDSIADKGIAVVMAKMPDNLAILNYNAADAIPLDNLFPEVTDWYIGGHSLGGASASIYLAGLAKKDMLNYKGLVLMGAYSSKDLKNTNLNVLCIYGSEDKVMNREKYDEGLSYLPAGYTETVIEGGCHSYFGDYGMQDGDGTPTVTSKEQWDITSTTIMNFVIK